MSEILDFMRTTALDAGKLAMEYFNGIKPNEMFTKSTAKDMVSTADREVEKRIISAIRAKFPDHGIYAEESGKNLTDSEYCWVLDPIDGTSSFIRKHPYFSISIGLMKNGESVAGTVFAPALDRMFMAEKGCGATLNGTPIHPSACEEIGEACCTTGFVCLRDGYKKNNLPLFCELAPLLRDIKRCGSAAMDVCHAASGTYDAYWEFPLNLYDVAAGVVIAREAGAVVCDLTGGNDVPYSGILVANPKLVPVFLEHTRKYFDASCRRK